MFGSTSWHGLGSRASFLLFPALRHQSVRLKPYAACAANAVTCGYASKVTIYSCRIFWRDGSPATQTYVLGVLSAIPFDWYARQMVESHVTVEFMRSAPVPRVPDENQLRKRVIAITGRLAAVDDRYAQWAAAVGAQVGSVSDEATKQDLIAELDAVVALLYGLGKSDVEHIFATFHRGWDYRPRLAAVLAHYDQWAATDGRTENK
jgi:hypothetical protein